MVLATIAFGLVASGILGALGSGTGARNAAMSDAAVSRTLDAIDDDVSRAFALHREQGKLRDSFELEDALMRNSTPYSSDPADRGAALDKFDDVIAATPSQLVLAVDADRSRSGVECVTWDARTRGGAFVVERTISATCGGTRLGSERFLTVQAAAMASAKVDTTPFSYKLLCNRSRCPGAGGGTPHCEPWAVTGTVARNQVRWVIEVTTSLTQIHGDRGAARAVGSSASTIRSRDTSQYRAGLGC